MTKALFSGLVTLSVFAGAAAGAAAQDLNSRLIECRSIADGAERLDCFDAAVAGLEASTPSDSRAAAESSDAKQTEFAAAPTLSPEERFGQEDLPKTKEEIQKEEEEKPDSLTASVVDIAKNRRDKYVVILENGQVWRQLNADTASLLLPSSDDEEIRVTIRRRFLGAHTLSLEGDNRSIRVERIK